MVGYQYSTTVGDQHAKALGHSLSISRKQAIQICNALRNKTVVKAKKILNEAISLERAIPFTRFNMDVGHKRGSGMAAGRFPVKACTAIKKLIENAEANAQFKGLTGTLIISHISAQQAPGAWHYGRQRRRQMKRCHVEVVLEETKVESKKEQKKPAKKEVKAEKKEEKPAAKPAAEKQ